MIDKKRVLKVSALVSIIIGGAILYLPLEHSLQQRILERENRPVPVLASADETKAIVSATLEHLDIEGVPPPPPAPNETPSPRVGKDLVLADESVCFSRDHLSEAARSRCDLVDLTILKMVDLDEVAPIKLRQELFIANREPKKLELKGLPHTLVVSSADIRALLRRDFWRGFYQKFPGTAGFAEFSRPVLSKDKQTALIYIGHHCDGLCGFGALILLERTAHGKWSVQKVYGLWQS